MSIADEIKDSKILKDVRSTVVGVAAAVASVAPAQAQEHRETNSDRAPEKIEIQAETNQTHEDTANTINFMDVLNEQMNADAQAWQVSDTPAPQEEITQNQAEEATQQQENAGNIEDRQMIADILDARGDGEGYLDNWDIERMAQSGETTKEDDTQDAKEGVRVWDETGQAPTRTFTSGRMGYYSYGDDYINIRETMNDEKADSIVAGIHDEEIRNCERDVLTFEPMGQYTTSHEGHHMRNFSRGLYSPYSENAWVGCEGTARADAADEIGARIAELNFVRDTYIRAGGGEAGLAALREIASIPSHNSMINGYINMIETGQVNPMSANPDDQKRDFEAMGRLAYDQWKNYDEQQYIPQMMRSGLRGAIDNHLPNVQRNEGETRRLCHMAMTLNVTMPNGEQQPVDFGNYVPEVTLPEGLSTALRTLDNNPDLVAEYSQNGSESFRNRTAQMERAVNASKGLVAGNDTKQKDNQQTKQASVTHDNATKSIQGNGAAMRVAMNRGYGRYS